MIDLDKVNMSKIQHVKQKEEQFMEKEVNPSYVKESLNHRENN